MPRYDDLPDIGAAAASAHVCCPHCGQIYRAHDKPALNASGRWITEAERDGREPDATIASYWLLGCAAAFQAWPSIVRNYLTALREFDAGGDEAALRATTNTDQGMPYLARKLSDVRGVEHLGARLESSERYAVPAGVRVLIAAVDVQANRFEIAIWGYGLGGERWLVDRYAITEHAGAKLQPAVFTEHWDALTERVVYGTYKLGGERELRIYRTFVDSGGYHSKKDRADSTARAHEWWRRLRTDGLAHRARLIKGAASRTAPLIKESLPDTRKRRDRSGSRGDVPMVFVNVDALKDGLASDLARDVAGPGYVHLPRWITRKHLDELNAEQRTPKGWEVIQGRRNETWDLAVYAHACWLWVGGPRLTESAAPGWFAEFESNVEVITKDQRRDMKAGATQVKRRRSSWL
jgi:phage terminase large subunit GpA-like protein